VAELARRLKMSYMGVKQHCVDLEKKGYLDTWRRPKAMGRPEKAYRLTPKCDPLFPELGLAFTGELLEFVKRNHGATAADKALFQYFQHQAGRYAAKVKGRSVAELASSFAKLRDAEGYRSKVEPGGDGPLRIVEYHSLVAPLGETFPNMLRMEEAMFGKVLRREVRRRVEHSGALKRYVFEVVGTSGS
jgi:predicted ArsR family transcriptional regulator